MTYTILLFGPYADAVGKSSVMVDDHGPEPCTVRVLLEQLQQDYPQLRDLLPAAMLAVNCRRVDGDRRISATDELALIGMVSGG